MMQERQPGPPYRADHVARYRWAATHMSPGTGVLDAGCGTGYGAAILAEAGCAPVWAVDREPEVHARHPGVKFTYADLDRALLPAIVPRLGAVVAFEVLEHLDNPLHFLEQARLAAPRLLVSVPNQDVFPYDAAKLPYHRRHFTRATLGGLLAAAGWTPSTWWGQLDKTSAPALSVHGRTLIVEAD